MAPKPGSRVDPRAAGRSRLSGRRFSKAEDWFDCPALGPGWKRRENFRKRGATCGLSDTYYLSPSGEQIRSKVELARYLGPGWDLSSFHFKLGVLQPSPAQAAAAPRSETKRPRRGPGRPRKEPAPPPLEPPDPQGPRAAPLAADLGEAPEPGDPAQTARTQPAEAPRGGPAEGPRGAPAEGPRGDAAQPPRTAPAEPPQSDRGGGGGGGGGGGHPRRRWRQRWLQTLGGEGLGGDPPGEPADPREGASGAAAAAAAAAAAGGCASAAAAAAAATTAVPADPATPLAGVSAAPAVPAPAGAAHGAPARIPTPAAAAAAPAAASSSKPRIVEAGARGSGCGLCAGCQAREDCGVCWICAREGKPGLVRHWRCLARRCLQKRLRRKPRGAGARKPPSRRRAAPAPPPQGRAVGAPLPAAERHRRARRSRRCGTCAACRRPLDCGECDFCLDKPKFGGCNQKRQKCRWRQCLSFAVKRLLPAPRDRAPAPRPRRAGRLAWARARGRQAQRLVAEARRRPRRRLLPKPEGGAAAPPPPPRHDTSLVILHGGERIPVLGPSAEADSPAPPPAEPGRAPGPEASAASPPLQREAKTLEPQAPEAGRPPDVPGAGGAEGAQLQQAVKEEEDLGAERVGSTPVIMEIYSLGKAAPAAAGLFGTLDSVLQEFLMELNELPLPAHWEVLPTRGPDLCLIQRSILSTVAAAVIHIQPGLYFRVVVRDVPVPPTHELYSAHPLRLTTVDEVIELICSLEAYHLCPGWPDSWHQGPRSPGCDVLVYEGRCQYCCLKPWSLGRKL